MTDITKDALTLVQKVSDMLEQEDWDGAFGLVQRFGSALYHGLAIITVEGTEESNITGNELRCLELIQYGIAFAEDDDEAREDAKCFLRRLKERLDGTVASWVVLSCW